MPQALIHHHQVSRRLSLTALASRRFSDSLAEEEKTATSRIRPRAEDPAANECRFLVGNPAVQNWRLPFRDWLHCLLPFFGRATAPRLVLVARIRSVISLAEIVRPVWSRKDRRRVASAGWEAPLGIALFADGLGASFCS